MQTLYLFYQKDGALYQVLLTEEQWDYVRGTLLSVTKGTVPVSEEKFCEIKMEKGGAK